MKFFSAALLLVVRVQLATAFVGQSQRGVGFRTSSRNVVTDPTTEVQEKTLAFVAPVEPKTEEPVAKVEAPKAGPVVAKVESAKKEADEVATTIPHFFEEKPESLEP